MNTTWGFSYVMYTISAVSLSKVCPFNIWFLLNSSFYPAETEQWTGWADSGSFVHGEAQQLCDTQLLNQSILEWLGL